MTGTDGREKDVPLWDEVSSFFVERVYKVPGYEYRSGQMEMARSVSEALEQDKILIVEAGTGLGKSMAYLVPALFWAHRHSRSVVVSTRTINLQQQLLERDIPALMSLLDFSIHVVAFRGWSNYLCLKRLEAFLESYSGLEEDVYKVLRSELESGGSSLFQDLVLPSGVWLEVCAEPSSCIRKKCRYHKECRIFRDRELPDGAALIVTNHALILSDLALKIRDKPGLLPEYVPLIFDESHHLETLAAEHLGREFSSTVLTRFFDKLYSVKGGNDNRGVSSADIDLHQGFLAVLERRLSERKGYWRLKPEDWRRKWHEEVLRPVLSLSSEVLSWVKMIPASCYGEQVFIEDVAVEDLFGGKELRAKGRSLRKRLVDYVTSLNDWAAKLESSLPDEGQGLVAELYGRVRQLEALVEDLDFFLHDPDEDWIYITSHGEEGFTIKGIPLDVSRLLAEHLFCHLKSAVLTSATLAVRGDLSFYESRIGIDLVNKEKMRACLESPFDYSRQVCLGIPTDLPEPSSERFCEEVSWPLVDLVEHLDGRTFLLVTSWKQLKEFESLLRAPLSDRGIQLLVQGQASGEALLERFRSGERFLLLGTDSFWEGVDVPGEALVCVVLAKLPFKSPADPLVKAKERRFKKMGANFFMNYMLPQAVLKLKQGFGRLIRTSSDRGIVLILDKRILHRRYGRYFLDSLPSCHYEQAPWKSLVDRCWEWYSGEL